MGRLLSDNDNVSLDVCDVFDLTRAAPSAISMAFMVHALVAQSLQAATAPLCIYGNKGGWNVPTHTER